MVFCFGKEIEKEIGKEEKNGKNEKDGKEERNSKEGNKSIKGFGKANKAESICYPLKICLFIRTGSLEKDEER